MAVKLIGYMAEVD